MILKTTRLMLCSWQEMDSESFYEYEKDYLKDELSIRLLSEDEIKAACDLALRVFMKYEAPDYSKEGIQEFIKTIENSEFISKMKFFGAFVKDELIGMIAIRRPQHISLFFVEEEFQSKGFGRRLFEFMKSHYEKQVFTVNSSPYAVQIYRSLGFIETDKEQITKGIRYTPMKYED